MSNGDSDWEYEYDQNEVEVSLEEDLTARCNLT